MENELLAQRRDAVAIALTDSLSAGCVGSSAAIRGSLATGAADAFSDIDLTWVVLDRAFSGAVASVADIARAAVGDLVSIRTDPDLTRSTRRRLVFLRFAELPMFWRVDVDIRAASVAADDRYDLENPAARTDSWSRAASAFENAVAAVKELERGRPDAARELLQRGHDRARATE